jgi:hypothetical protein
MSTTPNVQPAPATNAMVTLERVKTAAAFISIPAATSVLIPIPIVGTAIGIAIGAFLYFL